MNQLVPTSSTSKTMAKKSQTGARRNNTQAGRRVVNFYNFGTVNLDGRQNNSVNHKADNRGSNLYYPNTSANGSGVENPPNHDQVAEVRRGVLEIQPVKADCADTISSDSNAMSKLTKILIGAAIAAIATGAVLMIANSN